MFDKEVEDLVRMRGLAAEDALSDLFGEAQSLKSLRVRIMNDLK